MSQPHHPRRTALKVGAWAAPVVMMAGAAPAFAASPFPVLQAFITPPQNASGDSIAAALGARHYFTAIYQNIGTGTLAAGSTISLVLAAASAWDEPQLNSSTLSSLPPLTEAARSSEPLFMATAGGEVGRASFDWVIPDEVPPNQPFTVTFSAHLRPTFLEGTGYADLTANINMRAFTVWTPSAADTETTRARVADGEALWTLPNPAPAPPADG